MHKLYPALIFLVNCNCVWFFSKCISRFPPCLNFFNTHSMPLINNKQTFLPPHNVHIIIKEILLVFLYFSQRGLYIYVLSPRNHWPKEKSKQYDARCCWFTATTFNHHHHGFVAFSRNFLSHHQEMYHRTYCDNKKKKTQRDVLVPFGRFHFLIKWLLPLHDLPIVGPLGHHKKGLYLNSLKKRPL